MLTMRTTTGQTLSITYEPATNSIVFAESDWFAAPVRSGGVPGKACVQRSLGAMVAQLAARRIRRPGRRAA